jgi:DNA-directed RNA polymerase specialized sigma24 family protein
MDRARVIDRPLTWRTPDPEVFVRTHFDAVRRLAYRLGGAADDPDQLVREVFLRALPFVDAADPEATAAATLQACAVRAIRSYVVTGKARRAAVAIRDGAVEAMALRRVYATAARMSEPVGTSLLLRHVEGFDLATIAWLMSTSESRALAWLTRAERRAGIDERAVRAAVGANGFAYPQKSDLEAMRARRRVIADLARRRPPPPPRSTAARVLVIALALTLPFVGWWIASRVPCMVQRSVGVQNASTLL